jgi:8-oxo-dGTP pyrophosphatase MutT (NUDIX family)
MRRFVLRLGRVLFWLAWPAYWVYLRRGKRTRVLLVAPDGSVLLIKGWMNDGLYSLPGGGLHTGEDSLAGALRETAEETGIQLQPGQLQLLGEAVYSKAGLRYGYVMYAARLPKKVPPILQWYEIAEAIWVQPAGLSQYGVSQEIPLCLAAARSRRLLQ